MASGFQKLNKIGVGAGQNLENRLQDLRKGMMQDTSVALNQAFHAGFDSAKEVRAALEQLYKVCTNTDEVLLSGPDVDEALERARKALDSTKETT